MSLIDAVEVYAVRLPLDQPIFASQVHFRIRDYVLVRVRCDDGSSGIESPMSERPEQYRSPASSPTCSNRRVTGRNPEHQDEIWRSMFANTLIQGRTGLVMNGISAIDIELWDRNSRAAAKPLYRFLGADRVHAVPTYASGGYYGVGLELEKLRAEIEDYVAAGFAAVKIKTGRLSVEEEEKRVAVVREVLGTDGMLLLDAYHSWPDEDTALRYIERMLPL